MKENSSTPSTPDSEALAFTLTLAKIKPTEPIGWFQWMHEGFMSRSPLWERIITYLPQPEPQGWQSWPSPASDCSSLYTEQVKQIERHAWQFGFENLHSILLTVWKDLSPQARGRALAGLSEECPYPQPTDTPAKIFTWISERCHDDADITFDSDSVTQLICNFTRREQALETEQETATLLQLSFENVNQWGDSPVHRYSHGGPSNSCSKEMADLSSNALDRCLEAAVRSDHSEATRRCLEAGADPDINVWILDRSYNEKHCALTFALSYRGCSSTATPPPSTPPTPLWQLLLAAGANAAGTRFSGLNKPLFYAVRTNQQVLTEYLLDSGATFEGGELLEHFEQGYSDALITRLCSVVRENGDSSLDAIKADFEGLIPLTEIKDTAYFHDGNGQGGQHTSFLSATRSLQQLKFLAARGLPLKPTIVELLADVYPFERMKYIAQQTCGTPEHIIMYHFRKVFPDCGTFGMQFLCRPEPNGSNLIKKFNPHGLPALQSPGGIKFYVDLDSIAAPGHQLGSLPQKHIFVRKVTANFRRRESHLITRGLQTSWQAVPIPGTTNERLNTTYQIGRLLPIVKEQDGKFFWIGLNFTDLEKMQWPAANKERCQQWKDQSGEKILHLASERIAQQQQNNPYAAANVLSDDHLQAYPHEFWPYLRPLANHTIGVTTESCADNPSIQVRYQQWALANKPDMSTFIPDPRLMKLPWWDSTPWELQPFFEIGIFNLACAVSSQNRNDYEQTMIKQAVDWKNGKFKEAFEILVKKNPK
ncbi:MAG: hypothetical protein QM496_14550 [Verrucomicrobiota bacterium]